MLSPRGMSKSEKRQTRMKGTYVPFPSPAPFLTYPFALPGKQGGSLECPWLATYSHHQAQRAPQNFTLCALTLVL